MNPYVTVLMPVYNSEMYLKEAIDSILNQTFRDFEFIVINDGSTDSTSDIIKSYSDPRIIYLQNEKNCGVAKSLNMGLRIARGKYIVRMDADDISLPDRLEKQVSFMDANPGIGVCGTWLKTFGNGDVVWTPPGTHDEIFVGIFFCYVNTYHPTVIIRKDTIFNLQEFYNEDFSQSEDVEYWARLANLGVKFANIEKVLLKYRLHEENVSKTHHEIQKKYCDSVRLMHFRRLGLELTEEEMSSYNVLMTGISSNKETIEKVSQLIIKIQEANNITKFFSNPMLSRELAHRWFVLCYNSSFLSRSFWTLYFGNPISMKLPVFRILFRRVRKRFTKH
jgi:glycosyltransferase involved in cell wall biosynthesis